MQAQRFGAHAGGDRVVGSRLVERADGADGLVEQRDLGREGVAEEAGDAQGHVDPRPAELGQRDDLVAGDAPARRVPDRLGADEGQGLGDVVAAGAHVGGAPGREAEGLRVAVILEVADEQVLGGFLAERPGGGRRHGAVVEGIEIAAGGQDIEAAARRRAGGAGGDEASVEPVEQGFDLAGAAGAQGGADDRVDRLDHGFDICLIGATHARTEFVVLHDGPGFRRRA